MKETESKVVPVSRIMRKIAQVEERDREHKRVYKKIMGHALPEPDGELIVVDFKTKRVMQRGVKSTRRL